LTQQSGGPTVDFNRDVLPILSNHCFQCHGPDAAARKAKLRLDTKDGAFRVRDGVTVIVPGKSADSELYRRVSSHDDTEVMPTPEEVDAFLAHPSPGAYEKVVDRLLASPRYGERMAWDWLDAARYADSNGYQGDGDRTMWPWRDWVVQALNANVPFDRFTVEQ